MACRASGDAKRIKHRQDGAGRLIERAHSYIYIYMSFSAGAVLLFSWLCWFVVCVGFGTHRTLQERARHFRDSKVNFPRQRCRRRRIKQVRIVEDLLGRIEATSDGLTQEMGHGGGSTDNDDDNGDDSDVNNK